MKYPHRIVAIDFETLGLSPQWDAPNAVAAVLMEDGVEIAHYETAIIPERGKLSLEAYATQAGESAFDRNAIANHIARLFPDDAVTCKEAHATLRRFLAPWEEGLAVVAHNAAFDYAFYANKLLRTDAKNPALPPMVICTMEMAKRILPGQSHSLESVAKALGLDFDPKAAHSALYDARIAGQVYFNLLERASW